MTNRKSLMIYKTAQFKDFVSFQLFQVF